MYKFSCSFHQAQFKDRVANARKGNRNMTEMSVSRSCRTGADNVVRIEKRMGYTKMYGLMNHRKMYGLGFSIENVGRIEKCLGHTKMYGNVDKET